MFTRTPANGWAANSRAATHRDSDVAQRFPSTSWFVEMSFPSPSSRLRLTPLEFANGDRLGPRATLVRETKLATLNETQGPLRGNALRCSTIAIGGHAAVRSLDELSHAAAGLQRCTTQGYISETPTGTSEYQSLRTPRCSRSWRRAHPNSDRSKQWHPWRPIVTSRDSRQGTSGTPARPSFRADLYFRRR